MAKIAIIGTGISGLGVAAMLHPLHDITVYEKDASIGGHTRTLTINYSDRKIAVDTGFIVFNHLNYPLLTELFKHLKVATHKSAMSFGVTDRNRTLEWGAESLNAVFGQRKNLLNPRFYAFLFNVLRFNASAVKEAAKHPDLTLGQLIKKMALSDWFARYYILPMGGAIWSCPLSEILDFPARTFVDFFDAHGLLTVTQQPQWYTVTGGSHNYIAALTEPFKGKIRLSCGVTKIRRQSGKVQLTDICGETLEYDHVILASHADQALALLDDPDTQESNSLQAFRYQKNLAVLHKDCSLMPKRKLCWASWVYHADDKPADAPLAVTYWMNKLQGIDNDYPLFVTLNPPRPIAAEHIFDQHYFDHPIYSQQSIAAQKLLPALQGKRNTWFCGAYHRNGFHEDGLASAVDVAKQLGGSAAWAGL